MLQVGVNSWISIADADSYFADMWGASFWTARTNTEKGQLLVTAFRWINSSGYSIAPTSTLLKVKNAQCELAQEVYNAYEDYKKRQTLYATGVRSFNFDGWQESLVQSGLPAFIQDMLKDYKVGDVNFFNVERDY